MSQFKAADPSRLGSSLWLLLIISLLCLGELISAVPTRAAMVTDRPILFSFDGADSTAGHLVKPNKVAIDDATGSVYVSEGEAGGTWRLNEVISKFDVNGVAVAFTATGDSSLSGAIGDDVSIAVDNSGGPTQGRIYVLGGRNHVLRAYEPSGQFLWELGGFDIGEPIRSDIAVDHNGHPWVLAGSSVREYANVGTPPLELKSCGITGPEKQRFGLDLDANGNIYVAGFNGVDKYEGCTFDSTLDSTASLDLFADQSEVGGHVFTSHREAGNFNEYSGSTLLGTYGADAIASPHGIVYNKVLDRVYVANDGLGIIEAFGSPATETVPDPMIKPTTVEGPGTVTFHGTINPQGAASSYYFEWIEATELGNSFASSSNRDFRSPEFSSLPADSSAHAVEFQAHNLRGNVPWKVRLVAVNSVTGHGLRAVSEQDVFKSSKASDPPEVTINPVEKDPTLLCDIGIKSAEACVSGAVNPKNDSVEVTIEWMSGEACETVIEEKEPTRSTVYVPGGGVTTGQPFKFNLERLTSGEHYCLRFRVRNSANPNFAEGKLSTIEQFDTLPNPPSEVSTAFAGPRADTSARINGRVNPEGKTPFRYQFEWSEDGTSWNELGLHERSVDAHDPIIVADELTGLAPDTEYFYRLALVENEAGSALAGSVTSFRTRSTAEMNIPVSALGDADKPGIELVNNPDKGNQNLFFESFSQGVEGDVPFISLQGARARWSVTAGAPGSPSGVGGQFAAERKEDGWRSRSLEPPASQQFGGGSLVYNIVASNSGQSRFIADLRSSGLSAPRESTISRLDAEGNEEVLHTFKWLVGEDGVSNVDMSDDGAHVLLIDPVAKQLADIGSGTPEVISLMPGSDAPSQCGLATGEHTAGLSGFVGGRQWRFGYHMMATTNANLVYFRARPDGECGQSLGLYVRDRDAGQTTLIDPGTEGHNVEFIRATPDGGKAYFATFSQLDKADTNLGADLYRWDQSTKEATCLTCVVRNANLVDNGGLGPVMISDDFSYAYFVSRERLVTGRGAQGQENIYMLTAGEIHFIGVAIEGGSGGELVTEALERGNAILSNDGETLVFASSSGVKPRLSADMIGCGICAQLYRYEDRGESLECLSCASKGATTAPLGSGAGGVRGAFNLSGDGSTVGFVTPQSLSPRDVNGAADVYQWRDGALRLITDGVSEAQTGLAAPGVRGIDANGTNMLFSVLEPGLTGFEQDELANLYDARIGGGFARPIPADRCVEDACQGPLVGPPPTSGISSTNGGRGNPTTPRPCARKRGIARSRCLRHHKKRHHHRRKRHTGGAK